MRTTGLIYKYTNRINGKIYIGQTTTGMTYRQNQHLYQLDDNTYFHRAIKKYGIENFDLEIIEDNIQISELDDKEIFYIKKFQSYYTSGLGYNLTKGGQWGTSNQKLFGTQDEEIKKLILTTSLSFKDIAKRYNVTLYCISDINRGKTFYDKNLKYPLRQAPDKSQLTTEIVEEIIKLLQTTDMTAKEIANQYSIHEYTVGQINRGHNSWCPKIYTYPIKLWEKQFTYNNVINKNDVINICYDIIFTNDSLKNIGKKYNIALNTIGDISRGISWKEITNNFICPIRKNKSVNQEIFNKIYGIV